jgi:hypothetical protein
MSPSQMGFQPSKVQKPALTAPFNGSLAYVFAARRTVGHLVPLWRKMVGVIVQEGSASL